jgi:hypothetical protein
MTFFIYLFFAVDERYSDIIKLGKSRLIINRLNNYKVERIKEVELKYFTPVKNKTLIENCLKLQLKSKQVFENVETYKVEPAKLKK